MRAAQPQFGAFRIYSEVVSEHSASGGRRVRVGSEFVFAPAPEVPTVLQIEARVDTGLSLIEDSFTCAPDSLQSEYLDLYRNRCRRLVIRGRRTVVRYEAVVETHPCADPENPSAGELPVSDLPAEALHYTLPSRLCESDLLSPTAWRLFGGVEAGWARAQAVADWVHDAVEFAPQSSGPMTTASQVYLQRIGVCRDFAQLTIAFLRALNIPARYCFGYLPDIGVEPSDAPMDFVAWLEAYLGGDWYVFDPRNGERRTGRVLVGRGRDAVDVAMVTSYGTVRLVGLRVCAEDAADPPWSSARRPVIDEVGTW